MVLTITMVEFKVLRDLKVQKVKLVVKVYVVIVDFLVNKVQVVNRVTRVITVTPVLRVIKVRRVMPAKVVYLDCQVSRVPKVTQVCVEDEVHLVNRGLKVNGAIRVTGVKPVFLVQMVNQDDVVHRVFQATEESKVLVVPIVLQDRQAYGVLPDQMDIQVRRVNQVQLETVVDKDYRVRGPATVDTDKLTAKRDNYFIRHCLTLF